MKMIRVAKTTGSRLLRWHSILAMLVLLGGLFSGQGQGTVTFDNPWIVNGTGFYWRYYDSSGMWIHVVHATAQFDGMGRMGVGLAGHPDNGTPHMEYSPTPGYDQHVEFSLTNGNTFGLVSVDLADPVAPSLAPIPIMFVGNLAGGATVTNTFTFGGGNSSTFQTFNFTPDFATGLTSVMIPSSTWAIDNIVFIPEPSTAGLLLLGGGLWGYACRRRKP